MSLDGKRVLITGANGGLGLATSTQLLSEGATVLMACRTVEKAERAREQALTDSATADSATAPDRAIAAGGFDMLDPVAIEAAVDALPVAPLDVVFLQAGGWVVADGVQTVELGGVSFEETVAKNVLGAHSTFRALLATGRLAPGARVVIIGGEGARGVPGGIAKPEFTDVDDYQRYLSGDWTGRGSYVPVDALGVAKLAAAHWAQALTRRVPGQLEVLWFTPGLIGGTGGTQGLPAWKEFLFQRVGFPIMVALGKAQWPDAAARKCVDCLAGRVGEHGDLLGAPEGTALGELTDQKPLSPLFTDVAYQEALWRRCVAAAGDLPQEARRTG